MCCVPWDIKIRSGRVSTGAGSARALEPGLCVHRVVQGGLPDASPDERPAGWCRAGGAAAVGRCPGPCADAAVVRRGPGRGLGGDLCQGGPDRRPLADLGAARPLRARGHRPRALVRALGRMVERTSPPWRRRSSGPSVGEGFDVRLAGTRIRGARSSRTGTRFTWSSSGWRRDARTAAWTHRALLSLA